MKKIFRWFSLRSLHSKTSLAVTLTAAVLIEVTSAVQYFFAKEGIRQEVEHRAQSELRAKSLEIRNVMTAVEVAVENMSWAVEQRLAQPDSLLLVTQKLLADNQYIVGSAVAFEPYYYKEKGRQFSPYTYKHDGTTTSLQLGTDQYDYHSMEWYTAPIQSGQAHWSEPYFDEGGGEMMMSTYSLPIHDATGRCVGVFTADVSLDWLSETINARHIYPSSYNVLVSRSGQIMACPVESLVMHRSISEVTANMEDTVIQHINRQLAAGKSGQAVVHDDKGQKKYLFYALMDENTGWAMAVVCPDREIFRGLRQVTFNLSILMLFGVALLSLIIWRAARSAQRLQAVNEEKGRIENELHIARAIQMSMLPKTFPPCPDCDEITMYARLTPAKAVGGDLYDFYIREGKLFFCIGDVSGKGIPASMVMAVTRALFRTISAHESRPERIVSAINNTISEDNETNMFVTLFVGVIDLQTGHLFYCNAGHDAPVLISRDGRRIGMLPVDCNLPAGVMNGWTFSEQDTFIDSGTTIFLYTDGLTEAENAEHGQFGEERMTAQLSRLHFHGEDVDRRSAIRACIDQMTDAVHAFVGDAEQSDDLTMMAIQYCPKHEDEERRRLSITLPNDIATVPKLQHFIDEVGREASLDASLTMSLNLAVEEAVVNVMEYAYPQGTIGTVSVVATMETDMLSFVISDSGSPFDPTSKAEVDTTLSVEERPIGGLGIHLVRQIMDSVCYERKDDKNILTLRKKIDNI